MSIGPMWNIVQVAGRVLGGLFAVGLVYSTAAPLVHTNAWWIRVFDFPRPLIVALIALALACYALLRAIGRLWWFEVLLIGMVAVSLIVQLTLIAPYTVFHPKAMADSPAEGGPNRLSIMVFNVLYDSRAAPALRDLVQDIEPDIILLAEPTQWWFEQLEDLSEAYPYAVHQPQENHYGMLIYSKLELVDPATRFLVDPAVPSVRVQVRLRSGTLVTLYGVHPRPPGLKPPSEAEGGDAGGNDDRQDSDGRDAELFLIATEVGDLGDVPVLVAGDFNDVVWSSTMRRFQRVGGFLDPRVGRGTFSTFDTTNVLLRFPLDHVFASQHFLLVELRRLPDIGSDHFPLLVVLDYDPNVSVSRGEPEMNPGDRRAAEQAIDEGKSRD